MTNLIGLVQAKNSATTTISNFMLFNLKKLNYDKNVNEN